MNKEAGTYDNIDNLYPIPYSGPMPVQLYDRPDTSCPLSEIWVLGSNNPNANKSIEWNETFPNFTDPDVVIVNLQSLNKDVNQAINKDEYKLARDLMWDRFVHGGTLIFITARHAEIISGYLYDEPPLLKIRF
ncbi:MAG: hypothetical protein WBZ36_24335 [Candidatus Nitrosopolaris sp.]